MLECLHYFIISLFSLRMSLKHNFVQSTLSIFDAGRGGEFFYFWEAIYNYIYNWKEHHWDKKNNYVNNTVYLNHQIFHMACIGRENRKMRKHFKTYIYIYTWVKPHRYCPKMYQKNIEPQKRSSKIQLSNLKSSFKPATMNPQGWYAPQLQWIVQISYLGDCLSLMLIGERRFFILFYNYKKNVFFMCVLCISKRIAFSVAMFLLNSILLSREGILFEILISCFSIIGHFVS